MAIRRKTLTLEYKNGLHARPSMELCKILEPFSAEVHLVRNNSRANAKSILDLLSSCVQAGSTVVFEANGDDAEEAIMAVERFFHMLNTEQHW
jgi:phosphotransferase system HPr (HPr) family protein